MLEAEVEEEEGPLEEEEEEAGALKPTSFDLWQREGEGGKGGQLMGYGTRGGGRHRREDRNVIEDPHGWTVDNGGLTMEDGGSYLGRGGGRRGALSDSLTAEHVTAPSLTRGTQQPEQRVRR